MHVPPAEAPSPYWSLTEGVFNCLLDEARTGAYRAAIANTVARGDVVVDMGSGSGILALFAAERGARTVYAVEYDGNNIDNLVRTVALNGFEHVIRVIHGDVTTVDLPERVDVIVGEMIATGLIEELQVPAGNNMLRFARPNVKVLLRRYDTFVDLVENDDEFYGFQFYITRYEYPGDRSLRSRTISHSDLLCSVDLTRINEDDAVERVLTLRALRAGRVNGLRISGKSTFHDGSEFTDSSSYSYPIVMPTPPLSVREGDELRVEVAYRLCGGLSSLTYRVSPA